MVRSDQKAPPQTDRLDPPVHGAPLTLGDNCPVNINHAVPIGLCMGTPKSFAWAGAGQTPAAGTQIEILTHFSGVYDSSKMLPYLGVTWHPI